MRGARGSWIAVALLLAAMFLQAVLSMRLLSATFDETAHLPSGYSYLKTGDFRLNPQHPPLVKLLSALPLLALDPTLNLDDPAWTGSPPNEWAFGYRFLYGNDADRLLFWGRLPNVLLGLLTALYVFRWARDLYGPTGGLLSLSLCAFSPTVIAHARFVTFDVGLACFSTLSLYHLWRYLKLGGRGDLALGGASMGLTLASKFSGVILPGVVVVLIAAWVLAREAPETGRVTRLRRGLVALAVSAVLAGLVVQASYFFSADPLQYVHGLSRVNADHDPGYPYYLLGEFTPGGSWYYFIVAFLIKTPLPTLILLGAAVVLRRRFTALPWLDELFLAVPILGFTIATSAMADNLGIRYLLPVYPLIFIFAGRLGRAIGGAAWTRVLAAALALWYVGGAVAIYPDHLAYFNELVGGPANGHRFLDDSNIDWGQDLKRLKSYMERNGIESVKLRYGRNVAPDHYGIRWEPISDTEWSSAQPPPGIYAFGTHLLIRGEYYARERGLPTDWLSRHEPIDRIGYSIYLFRF